MADGRTERQQDREEEEGGVGELLEECGHDLHPSTVSTTLMTALSGRGPPAGRVTGGGELRWWRLVRHGAIGTDLVAEFAELPAEFVAAIRKYQTLRLRPATE